MENGKSFIRINGIGHAFSRELGCTCKRCGTIRYAMLRPPPRLAPFDGWDDPPWRAHTSASILMADGSNTLTAHILVDVGAGTVDSLVCSGIANLSLVNALLLTHWHPDHALALNQFCESLKRSAGESFQKIPIYCTLDTYDHLRDSGGQAYLLRKHLCFREILPEKKFSVDSIPAIQVTPLPVAHGDIKGAVIYVAEIGSSKVIFGWDMDIPDKQLPSGKETNLQIFERNKGLLKKAKIYFLPANTWRADETNGKKTGHTSYLSAHSKYLEIIKAKKTYLVHMSGHEDGVGNQGFGWTDSEWETAVAPHGVKVARQGMIIQI